MQQIYNFVYNSAKKKLLFVADPTALIVIICLLSRKKQYLFVAY